MILGMDIMEENDVHFNIRKKLLMIGNEKFLLDGDIPIMRIKVPEDVHFPEESESMMPRL